MVDIIKERITIICLTIIGVTELIVREDVEGTVILFFFYGIYKAFENGF